MTPSKVIPFPGQETKIPSASGSVALSNAEFDDDILIQADQTTEPIKNLADIQRIYDYFLQEQKNYRNAALFVVGISIGLRISDLVCMRWKDFYHDDWTPRRDCQVVERKTAKTKGRQRNSLNMNKFWAENRGRPREECLKILDDILDESQYVFQENEKVKAKPRKFRASPVVYSTLDLYLRSLTEENKTPFIGDYIFPGGQEGHMGRQAAWKIIDKATKKLRLEIRVGTHGLRKTFGYQMMEANGRSSKALMTLQQLFCHSSPEITLRYIGITREDINHAYEDVGRALAEVILYPEIIHETA